MNPRRIKAAVLRLEPVQEIGIIPGGFGRPDRFGEGAEAGQGHVLHLAVVRDLFRPKIALGTKDVGCQFRREICGNRFKGVDMLQGQGPAPGSRLGSVARLVD